MERNGLYPPSVQPGIPRLGRTPRGWTAPTFGDVLKVVSRPAVLEDDTDYKLVTARRSRGGIVLREQKKGHAIKTKTQFFVEAGDFLISRRQIVHGGCGIVPSELDQAIVSNEYLVAHANGQLLQEYLRWLCHSIYFQQTCFHSSIGVHVEKMVFRPGKWFRFRVNLPPKPEQARIVRILSVWENAIQQTANVISAKCTLKNMLMQELLAGRKRFRGNSRSPKSWSAATLGEISEIVFSNVDKLSQTHERPVRLCNYLDVYNNDYITSELAFMGATASETEIAKFGLKVGDVLITKDSETPEDIAKPATVLDELPGVVCGYHLAILRPKKGVHGPFLGKMLALSKVRNEFYRIANGATRYGLNLSAIRKVPLLLPSEDEQRSIASILFTLDQEIGLLRRKEKCLRSEIAGLAQKMLAGRLRVSN